jgi:outer membrane lipoprotein-sorting protein
MSAWKKQFRLMGIFSLLIITYSSLYSQQHDVKKIIQYLDELYRSKSSFAEMEMQIVTPHWERTLKMNIWTEGKDKTFIRITEPKKERGTATLRLSNEMWNYLPKTNKVIKIPPSMMMSSWMGSDFKNDDVVNEFSLLEDYSYQIIQPENPESGYLYVECIPREDLPIVWSKILMKIREVDYIPVKEEYYDEKDNLMRVMNYKQITEFDGRKIPKIMELIPQDEPGKKTVLIYIDAKFDFPIDKDVFTLRNLRSTI